MKVTFKLYLGGTWLVTAEHETGALLDALVQSDWDFPALVGWLRGKTWPWQWKQNTIINRSTEWLLDHEYEEFTFDQNITEFLESVPFRFAPVMDDVPPLPESWFLYFYSITDVIDVEQMDEDHIWTLFSNGKVKQGYDKQLGVRFYEVDYNKTREVFVG